MYDFLKNNKSSNIYWLKYPLQHFNLTLKLKAQETITLLPKFGEHLNQSNEEDAQNVLQYQEYNFQWQEKLFSQYQFTKFGDIQNCVSEKDLAFHRSIHQFNKKPQKVFTYVNKEYAFPLPFKSKDNGIGLYSSCIKKLNLEIFLNDNFGKGESMHNLFKSEDDVAFEDEWKAMYIFYDNSNYDEDNNLIFQDECLLISVYHNTKYNYIMISPDVNNESNPYAVESSSGYLDFEYFINVDFGKSGCGEEFKDLLNKLLKKMEKKQKHLIKFVMPPLETRKYYISLEIESAKDFDGDIYIEYHVKVPENIDSVSLLTGRTHLNKCLMNEDIHMWAFGHIVDFEVESATGIDPLPLRIFFEVISVDRWGRHRTEGYTYFPLALIPGFCKKQLSCTRPEELNEIDAESRRFFVGGYHLIEDLEMLVKPQLYATNFRFVSTGSIAVHWTVISHSHSPGCHSSENQSPVPHTSCSELIQGADAVLKQYKRAKETLAAATKSLIRAVDSE
ncbi:Meckel syndrome type 1 protein homolog [Pieris brassicae]|uniref:Meckel syndrome type 1 protein homolog n=1 Tax=Pieris brassicae TaxID=7116 RepID=UPI001E661C1A|nr:Meckel syndrome type 1 protein homolog [Pieris brassicae]